MTASNTVPEEHSCRTMSMDWFVREFQQVNEKGSYARKFCFVLGAGASISSGIPSGQKLVNVWDQELRLRDLPEYEAWRRAKGITDENKYNFYSQYYAKRFERDDSKRYHDGYHYLETLMDHAHPQIGYVMLALIMQRTQNNVVITTNFDHLVENSIVRFGEKMPLVIPHEALAHYLTDQVDRPIILKIHRDLLMDPISNPNELSRLNEKWTPALDYILSHYHPVFIGYAGNDQSVMNYLTQNVKKFTDGTWCYPYWMIYGEQEPDPQIAEFLKRSGAWLIRHNGFDNVMIKLGLELKLSIPSEAEMIDRAKKQHQEWMATAESKTVSDASKPGEAPSDSYPENEAADRPIPLEPSPITNGDAETLTEESAPKSDELSDPEQTESSPVCNSVEQTADTDIRKSDSESADSVFFNALLKERLGYLDAAIERKREAIRLDPQNFKYHLSLGESLLKNGRRFAGKREIQIAIKIAGKDLASENLNDAVLIEADLSDGILICTNLKGANLRNANLRGADLLGANLFGADLRDADLRDSCLSGAYLPDGFQSNIQEQQVEHLKSLKIPGLKI